MITQSTVVSTISCLIFISCAIPSKSTVTCANNEYPTQGLQENAGALDSAILDSAKGETLPSKMEWKLIAPRKFIFAEEVLELSFDESSQHWKILRRAESLGHLEFLSKSVRGEAPSDDQCLRPGLQIAISRNGIIESGAWWGVGM